MASKHEQAISHEELQRIEHANKILEEHRDLVKRVINETEDLLHTYLPILTEYINGVVDVRNQLAREIAHILRSSGEIQAVGNNTKRLQEFAQAVTTLDNTLTPARIEMLRKLTGAPDVRQEGS